MSATPSNAATGSSFKKSFLILAGPGLLLAGAGLGPGDVVTGTVAGANYGVVLLWAIVAGALFKFVLSEGIIRWQLAMKSTLLEGWALFLPVGAIWYFGIYLLLWSVIATTTITAAAGLAISNLTQGAISQSWGAVLHSLLAGAFVFAGGYVRFALLMKILAAVIMGAIVLCALLTVRESPAEALGGMLIPTVPMDSGMMVLSLISSVGGGIPMLCYCYWMREEKLNRPDQLAFVRRDIGISYIFTALFGVLIALIANHTFFIHQQSLVEAGTAAGMAVKLRELVGPFSSFAYSIAFWAAVCAPLFGVWQGAPYLYADFYCIIKKLSPSMREQTIAVSSRPYRLALLFITLAPLPFAFVGLPVGIVLLYTIGNNLFIPFLAATLLYMNNYMRWDNSVPRYSWVSDTALVVILVLFLITGLEQITNSTQ